MSNPQLHDFLFDPQRYAPAVAELLAPRRLNDLGPGKPNIACREKLARLAGEPAALCTAGQSGEPWAAACLAGLWLYHDFLDESHAASQEMESAEGAWWHGIMHRREPDYANAKYWFRRAGSHPAGEPLAESARRLAESHPQVSAAWFLVQQLSWDHFRFVDLCQAMAGTQSDGELLCRQVQASEWELLFDYCYRRACPDNRPG